MSSVFKEEDSVLQIQEKEGKGGKKRGKRYKSKKIKEGVGRREGKGQLPKLLLLGFL